MILVFSTLNNNAVNVPCVYANVM